MVDKRFPRRRKRRDESVTRKVKPGDPCPACEGTGQTYDRTLRKNRDCTHCEGSGREPEPK